MASATRQSTAKAMVALKPLLAAEDTGAAVAPGSLAHHLPSFDNAVSCLMMFGPTA